MITCTHPGKLGDLLWALPTIRHLAHQKGPVRLWLSAQCKPLVNLLQKQPYIAEVHLDYDWAVQDTAPATPLRPPAAEVAWIHLGYPTWPDRPLPFYTAAQVYGEVDFSPWITAVPGFTREPSEDVVLFHWTDRWFELKAGLTYVLTEGPEALPLTAWSLRAAPNSARWAAYRHGGGSTLENVARLIAASSLVVTDCSAVHVLTAAMGKRCVVVEPETDRHHFIFWPGSEQDARGRWHQADNIFGRLVFPVLGVDGKPTFDSRHTAGVIKELLRA